MQKIITSDAAQKLIGTPVEIYRKNGTSIKSKIKHVTEKAILFQQIDNKSMCGWLPKTIWTQLYFYSPIKGVTITLQDGQHIIWKDQSTK